MNQIVLSVNANKLSVTNDCYSTGGSVNYDECVFTFDNVWNGFTKTAVFSSGSNDSYRVELENGCCKIPAACLEKPGILRIGVFGINDDDVVITTNSVAHRVEEGVDTASDWIDEDNTIVRNAVKNLTNEINDFKSGLTSKFTELLKKVTDDTEINYEGYLSDWYYPDRIFIDEEIPLPSNGSDYGDYLDYHFNRLTREFPSYAKRYLIGEDANEEFDMYSYVFNPGNYTKSVVITACVHGTDRSALMALGFFLDNLCRNTEDKILAYIRNNIKLYVIPVVNPYGLENGVLYNSEDVNIGVNFPYKWNECTRNAKGESAADQAETQNVIRYLNSIKHDKLCAAVDLHSSNAVLAGRTIYYTKNHKNCATILAELLNDFNIREDDEDITSKSVLAASVNPTLSNYISNNFNINSCELVWNNTLYGGEVNGDNYTKYVEFIGNVLYRLALNSTAESNEKPQAFTKVISWKKNTDSDVYSVVQSETPVNMGISSYSMKIDMPCNIVVNGYVMLDVLSACTVKINPILYQINSSEQEYNDRKNSAPFIIELSLTPGTHIIPISSVLKAYYSSYNGSDDTSFCEDAVFVIAAASSAENSANITAFSATINAFPTDRAVSVEISSPMGLVEDYDATDIPVQNLIYPIGTVKMNDLYFYD